MCLYGRLGAELEAQLEDRNIMFELSEEATEWLAHRGYDEKFGARPLARVIQDAIKKPLADEILFGKLKRGGTVKVLVGDENDLTFEIIELPPRKKGKRKAIEDQSPKPLLIK